MFKKKNKILVPSCSYYCYLPFQCKVMDLELCVFVSMFFTAVDVMVLAGSVNLLKHWHYCCFFSWVQSFGHEGLGLLMDILERLLLKKQLSFFFFLHWLICPDCCIFILWLKFLLMLISTQLLLYFSPIYNWNNVK